MYKTSNILYALKQDSVFQHSKIHTSNILLTPMIHIFLFLVLSVTLLFHKMFSS